MNETRPVTRIGAHGAVIFAESFVHSEQFAGLFREGMGLVEETATYLDGKGREDSMRLAKQAALVYAIGDHVAEEREKQERNRPCKAYHA